MVFNNSIMNNCDLLVGDVVGVTFRHPSGCPARVANTRLPFKRRIPKGRGQALSLPTARLILNSAPVCVTMPELS